MTRNKFILFFITVLLLTSSCRKLPFDRSKPALKGIKSGRYATYYNNGRKKRVINYQNGFRHGRSSGYYPDGSLFWIVDYVRNKKEGQQLVYYRTGVLYSRSTFANGRLHGSIKKYRPDGRLEYFIPCRKGRISGNIIHYNYYNDTELSRRRKIRKQQKPVPMQESHRPEDQVWLSEERTDLEMLALPELDSLPPDDLVQPPLTGTEEKYRRLPGEKGEMPDLKHDYGNLSDTKEETVPATDNYPDQGLKEDEAWKYRMLEKGQDYDSTIKEGI